MLSRNQPWNWTKEEDERLRALVAQGASVVKAAAALKRKIVSVGMRARALGCPFPTLRVARQKWADTSDNVSTLRKRPEPPRGSPAHVLFEVPGAAGRIDRVIWNCRTIWISGNKIGVAFE